MNQLEKEIVDLMEKRYKAYYIGGIKVTKLLPVGYKLVLDFGVSDRPLLQISTDIDNPEDEQRRNDCKNESCNC